MSHAARLRLFANSNRHTLAARGIKRYSFAEEMKYQITADELGWRMMRMATVWLIGFGLATVMGWVAWHQQPRHFALVFGLTGVMLLSVSVITARRVRRCLTDNPVDVTPAAVSVPFQYGSIWIPYDLVTEAECDARKPQAPTLTIRAQGTPRYRIRGYRNMQGLIAELATRIPSDKWKMKTANQQIHPIAGKPGSG
jgi:hypothetical protein